MRFLDTVIRKFIAPYVEIAPSGESPVQIRDGGIVANHVHAKVEVLESLLLRTCDTPLELPFTLSMLYVGHAHLTIPWTLRGAIELVVEDVYIVVKDLEVNERDPNHVNTIREERLREVMASVLGAEIAKEDTDESMPYLIRMALRKVLLSCRPRLVVRNVHVRYEHQLPSPSVPSGQSWPSRPAEPFVCGLVLRQISEEHVAAAEQQKPGVQRLDLSLSQLVSIWQQVVTCKAPGTRPPPQDRRLPEVPTPPSVS